MEVYANTVFINFSSIATFALGVFFFFFTLMLRGSFWYEQCDQLPSAVLKNGDHTKKNSPKQNVSVSFANIHLQTVVILHPLLDVENSFTNFVHNWVCLGAIHAKNSAVEFFETNCYLNSKLKSDLVDQQLSFFLNMYREWKMLIFSHWVITWWEKKAVEQSIQYCLLKWLT